jgi:hypothetical protein
MHVFVFLLHFYPTHVSAVVQPSSLLYLELLTQDEHNLHLKVNKSSKNIVMTRDNTKWSSDSEVNLLVYRDDGWSTAETYVG